MTLTVKPAAMGLLDQFSVMDKTVRIAIVAESHPVPILIRGQLPADVSLAVIGRLIQEFKAKQPVRKGGL
jgi:hypothetical protein